MKINELKNLTVTELQNSENDLRRTYFELRCKKATNQPCKPHELRNARKDIARVKTMIEMKRNEGQK